ncbi:MAG: hypothetical protein ABEJ42_09115 [Halobacteriaceae archaeon]
MTPDDAVDALWRVCLSAPASWGTERSPGSLAGGAARAAGLLVLPVGFLCFVTALVFVLPPVAVAYDAVDLARLGLGRGGPRRP